MRHTEYVPLYFGISGVMRFRISQPFEERAALMTGLFFFVAQPFIPLQYPSGRVASVPQYCDDFYAVILHFPFGCFHQVFCYLTATMRFIYPQRINESVRLAIQGSVFCAVRNKRLYAAMMLLVSNEYSN